MKKIAASILLASSLVLAATIVTAKSSANVYPNEIRRVYERPIFSLDKGEVVEVIKWETPLTKIRNRKGRFGWVDPAKLDSLKRPPILNLVVDSESTEPAAKPAQKDGRIAPIDSASTSK